MNFVSLTLLHKDKSTVEWVNLDAVRRIKSSEKGTLLIFSSESGDVRVVKESFQEIMKKALKKKVID